MLVAASKHLRIWCQVKRAALGGSPRCASSFTDLPTPLCERKAWHICHYQELEDVLKECEDQAREAAPRLTGRDAPSIDDLLCELAWLADDVLESSRAGDGAPWQRSESWRSLQREAQGAGRSAHGATSMRLRATPAEVRTMWALRLQERVPIQYLTHTAHWRDMVLAVGPGVLIPRPETELLIDFAAAALRAAPQLAGHAWLDLGCGSGATALGLARLLAGVPAMPASTTPPGVVAVDASRAAVAIAAHNARRLKLAELVDVRHGTWCEPCGELEGRVGGVISNPPYIPSQALPGLQEEVGRHEPMLALDGGVGDGMTQLNEVIECAERLLIPCGFLALETNGGKQAHETALALDKRLCGPRHTFTDISVEKDYYCQDRFVLATRC